MLQVKAGATKVWLLTYPFLAQFHVSPFRLLTLVLELQISFYSYWMLCLCSEWDLCSLMSTPACCQHLSALLPAASLVLCAHRTTPQPHQEAESSSCSNKLKSIFCHCYDVLVESSSLLVLKSSKWDLFPAPTHVHIVPLWIRCCSAL